MNKGSIAPAWTRHLSGAPTTSPLPPLPHNHYLTTTTSPPLPHHYLYHHLTTTSPPPHHHYLTTTSPLPHHYLGGQDSRQMSGLPNRHVVGAALSAAVGVGSGGGGAGGGTGTPSPLQGARGRLTRLEMPPPPLYWLTSRHTNPPCSFPLQGARLRLLEGPQWSFIQAPQRPLLFPPPFPLSLTQTLQGAMARLDDNASAHPGTPTLLLPDPSARYGLSPRGHTDPPLSRPTNPVVRPLLQLWLRTEKQPFPSSPRPLGQVGVWRAWMSNRRLHPGAPTPSTPRPRPHANARADRVRYHAKRLYSPFIALM